MTRTMCAMRSTTTAANRRSCWSPAATRPSSFRSARGNDRGLTPRRTEVILARGQTPSSMRLDKRLKESRQDLSWRQIREAIEKGQATVNGRVEKDPGLDVFSGSAVELNLNRPAQSRVR